MIGALFELRITPQGVLTPVPSGDADDRGLAGRFSEDESAGLVALAAGGVPSSSARSVVFWRDLAAEFLRALCHVPEGVTPDAQSVAPPSPARLAEWVLNTPPMPGAEYLSPSVLLEIWNRLLAWSAKRSSECGGLTAFLESHAPQWARVGRVTLHLAESKNDPDYPFAFMATYAAGLSAAGKIRRLLLGRIWEL